MFPPFLQDCGKTPPGSNFFTETLLPEYYPNPNRLHFFGTSTSYFVLWNYSCQFQDLITKDREPLTKGEPTPQKMAETNGTKGVNGGAQVDVSVALAANDASAVKTLISEINVLGESFPAGNDQDRLRLLAKAKSLWQALETPRETMIRHNWAQVSLKLCPLQCHAQLCPYACDDIPRPSTMS